MVPAAYLFQLTPKASCRDAKRHVQALTQHGYTIQVFTTLTALVRHVNTVAGTPGDRIVAIVDGRDSGCAAAVSTLRALTHDVGIVVLVDRDDDATMIQSLQMGADTCSFVSASPDLWVASVSRLLWRLGHHNPKVSMALSSTTDPWKLVDQGWAMRSPRGNSIALTTGERAFLMTLLNAPLLKATHKQLISAVNASYSYAYADTQQSRLGVMVSRMRRKFNKAEAPLPLKSIHNWGYMFVMDS